MQHINTLKLSSSVTDTILDYLSWYRRRPCIVCWYNTCFKECFCGHNSHQNQVFICGIFERPIHFPLHTWQFCWTIAYWSDPRQHKQLHQKTSNTPKGNSKNEVSQETTVSHNARGLVIAVCADINLQQKNKTNVKILNKIWLSMQFVGSKLQ